MMNAAERKRESLIIATVHHLKLLLTVKLGYKVAESTQSRWYWCKQHITNENNDVVLQTFMTHQIFHKALHRMKNFSQILKTVERTSTVQ